MLIGLTTRAIPPAPTPLASGEALRSFLAWTTEEVNQAVESGRVSYAFDLRTPGSRRAALRLWQPSVEALVRSGGTDSGPRFDTIDQLLAQLVPDLFAVRSSTLERIWTLSPQHVHAILKGALDRPGKRQATRGPASYVSIEPGSLRRFLRSRLVGHAATSLN